jgi:hypothetical protein
MKQKFVLLVLFVISSISFTSFAQTFITEKIEPGSFPIVTASQTASIYVDENDDWLVHKAATLLQSDIEMVTGKKPAIISSLSPSQQNIIIIGTINGSATINALIKEKN